MGFFSRFRWWRRKVSTTPSAELPERPAEEVASDSAQDLDPPWDPEAAVELPIDGELDLHHFRPRDVKTLVPEYLQACLQRGIYAVRIVHGKGKGHLRRTVHAQLARNPLVAKFRLAPPERGGWGATLVDLKRDR